MLLSSLDFSKFGYRDDLTERALPMYTYQVLSRIPDFVPLFGVLLGGVYWITHRREEVAEAEGTGQTQLTTKAVRNDGPQVSLHLLEGRLPRHHGGRRVLHLRPLRPRTRRLDQPQRPVSLGALDRLRRDVRRHAGCRRLHPDGGGGDLQHQALALHHAAHHPHRLHGLPAGLRRAHVRPRPALEHLASAHHAQPALGDVRSRLLRDALHHGAGAGVLAHRLRAPRLEPGAARRCAA